jgi:hypothetical protein
VKNKLRMIARLRLKKNASRRLKHYAKRVRQSRNPVFYQAPALWKCGSKRMRGGVRNDAGYAAHLAAVKHIYKAAIRSLPPDLQKQTVARGTLKWHAELAQQRTWLSTQEGEKPCL